MSPDPPSPGGSALLIDTDVLIWFTRGHQGAAQRLQTLAPWCISVVTYIELAQGCRDRGELARLKKGLAARQTRLLQLTPAISGRAAALIDALALSHSLQLADALIAATALEHGLAVLTGNARHFAAVPGLEVDAFSA